MRGLDVALVALSLVPAGLTLPIPLDNQLDTAYTTILSLNVPGPENGGDLITLQLDLEEAKHPCGYAPMHINSQSLFQNKRGAGKGLIGGANGSPVVTASWQFTCQEDDNVPVGQVLNLTVHSVNGQKVPDVTLIARFRQVPPVSVHQVDGAERVSRMYSSPLDKTISSHSIGKVENENSDDVDSIYDEIHDKLTTDSSTFSSAEKAERVFGTQGSSQQVLGGRMDKKRKWIAKEEDTQDKMPVRDTHTLESTCRGFGCAFVTVKDTLASTIDNLKGVFGHMSGGAGCRDAVVFQIDETSGAVTVVDVLQLSAEQGINDIDTHTPQGAFVVLEEANDAVPNDAGYCHERRSQVPLLMSFALAAFGLGLFALWGLHKLHRRTSRIVLDDSTVSFNRPRFISRQGPHRIFFFRTLVKNSRTANIVSQEPQPEPYHDEKCELSEKESYNAPPSNSVDEELAGLQNALDLVSGLVMGGRSRYDREGSPASIDTLPPYENELDATPPAYVESEEAMDIVEKE